MDVHEGRVKRTLAKPLIQSGEERQAGEEVWLRPDQVERLDAEGVLEPAPDAGAKRGGKR